MLGSEACLIGRIRRLLVLFTATVTIAGCGKPATDPAAAGQGQAMPVKTVTVAASPVPQSDEYVATIKSRRSATLTPQVDGNLTRIFARSGDRAKAGQLLMPAQTVQRRRDEPRRSRSGGASLPQLEGRLRIVHRLAADPGEPTRLLSNPRAI